MGQPFVRWELWPEDPGKVLEFYETVFEWKISHLPEMSYRLVETGGDGGINGGIMTPQKGPWPGDMAFYIEVDDLDAYAEKIRSAGSKIVVDKMEVPGVGQLLLFRGPGRPSVRHVETAAVRRLACRRGQAAA